jgi:3-deoxy-D-manno-octulosonate 8-phosphate phosphatase (KDO 8-P phosphatase)
MTLTNEILLEKMRRVRVLISDVDGVLTDGRIIVNSEGVESKQFDVRDGHGLKLLIRYGIDVILVTGRNSRLVEWRAADLGIGEIYQGVWDKGEVFDEIVKKRGVTPGEIACIGDDVVDIPMMRRAGFSAAVADAVAEVIKTADYVAAAPGGRGAVREICEMLLKACGHWGDIAAHYGFDWKNGKAF